VKGPAVERVLRARARLGEGPAWDAATGTLLWVDIYDHRVHRYDPATGEDRPFDTGETVGFAVPAADGRILVGLKSHLAFLDPRDGSIERIASIGLDQPDSRINDGAVDPRGRLWFGTLSKREGGAALYRYSADGGLERMETGLTISNGLGWSPDARTFYLTDSPAKRMYAYDFDAERGTLSSRRTLAHPGDEDGFPDGLAVDAEGGVWSARFDGGCVVRYAPDGRETARIAIPVPRATSCAFGGADLRDLYVTTASVGMGEDEIEAAFDSGDLFRARVEVPGLAAVPFGARPAG
jgi:sugar lactone lactonase YvrE